MGMGGGGSGQLGDGNCDERSIPFRLSGLDCVLARSAGRDLTMALKRNGKYGCTVEVLTRASSRSSRRAPTALTRCAIHPVCQTEVRELARGV